MQMKYNLRSNDIKCVLLSLWAANYIIHTINTFPKSSINFPQTPCSKLGQT